MNDMKIDVESIVPVLGSPYTSDSAMAEMIENRNLKILKKYQMNDGSMVTLCIDAHKYEDEHE